MKKLDRSNKEALVKPNKELKDLKVKFIKEKADIAKSHKQEVKCWRRELGEERRITFKLEKKMKLWKLMRSLN